jgi:protein-S-isoprenylcysteine O-methyltransferase Ste14
METLPRVALPPKARAILYLVFSILTLALGATQVAYGAANHPMPTWLAVAGTVLLFLGTGFGLTAGSNTPVRNVPVLTPDPAVPQPIAPE